MRSSVPYLIVATALLAVAGTLAFGALHAILIVPIWSRLPGGLPFTLPAAAAIALCYRHLRQTGRIGHGFRPALGFGVLLWLSVLPTTAFGAILRLTRFHQQNGTVEVAGALLVAAATGALIGRFLQLRSWRLAGMALLPVALVIAMAGPVPVNNGTRPFLLLLGFLPVFAAAALLAAAAERLPRIVVS